MIKTEGSQKRRKVFQKNYNSPSLVGNGHEHPPKYYRVGFLSARTKEIKPHTETTNPTTMEIVDTGSPSVVASAYPHKIPPPIMAPAEIIMCCNRVKRYSLNVGL
jgi:hypothetical protein